jgi:hypothetical protein
MPGPADPPIGADGALHGTTVGMGEAEARHHAESWSSSERTRSEPPIGAAWLARDGRPAMGADVGDLHAPALALRILLVRQG